MKRPSQTKSPRWSWCLLIAAAATLAGCVSKPVLIPPASRKPIGRSLVEYPAGCRLQTVIRNLTCPTAMTFDQDGWLIVADQGLNEEPTLIGFRPDGITFNIYPKDAKLIGKGEIRGPVGGIVAAYGRIYALHRNAAGRGVITAFDYNGKMQTIVSDLPAEGDHGVLDLVLNRTDGRLYFSIGSITNSGVIGLDNWAQGWVKEDESACDIPAVRSKLLGYRFDTPNPRAGLFGGNDIAVTGPFQPFGQSKLTWVSPSPSGKPTAAIYSVSITGGDLRIEAHGLRCARGLAFNDFGRLYATNQGMELRGTRPVKNDPDTLLRIIRNTWYGWPDYSADLLPISEHRFHPGTEMLIETGYPELSSLFDHQASGLMQPDRGTLLQASFQPLSGAAKMDFVPAAGPLRAYSGSVVVALSGDRAPFATSGLPLISPIGYKVVQVDVDTHATHDFVYNTRGLPASMTDKNPDALERPFDIKFGPDGAMYILDIGRIEMKGAKAMPIGKTGKILRLDVAQ